MHSFEPHGSDVYMARILLSVQFMDVAIKIFDLCQEVKKGKINIQEGDMKDVA